MSSSSQPPTMHVTKSNAAPSVGWLELRIWAEQYNDVTEALIAATNRAERGGVDPDIYADYLESLGRAKHSCKLSMVRCLRRVAPPEIIKWQKASNGVGEHLLARLLGHLGHPVWATPHHWEGTGSDRTLVADEPFARSVGQLWQYCGHGAPARKRKGMSTIDLAAHGNPTLKMLVHLLAEACMKTRSSPYRLVYEQVRYDLDPSCHPTGELHVSAATGIKVHTTECVRCGPSGKPAQPGSPWSKGHQHAHALRIVGKEILRDLWIVAGGAHSRPETQWTSGSVSHNEEDAA